MLGIEIVEEAAGVARVWDEILKLVECWGHDWVWW